MAKLVFLVLLLVSSVLSDVYMHNPRGSNDRLNEANTNRNNNNRLFDSQNNAKGGYCVGPQMTYYEGSKLSVEWTNQHGCGNNPKVACQVVVQYMCGSTTEGLNTRIRDGTTTNTPNTNNPDASTGLHESAQSYANCQTRNRNQGLYIADRATVGNLNGGKTAAIYTRQNNNGARSGLECPEERDYYPYWHPTEWTDVAVMTSDTSACSFYQAQSENVLGRGSCSKTDPKVQTAHNTAQNCTAAGNNWVVSASRGVSAPDCVQAPWSRENHNGNGASGFPNTYNMTIPKVSSLGACANDDTCNCVLRMRYNVSTTEDGFPDMSKVDKNFIDSRFNGKNAVIRQNPVLNMTDGDSRQLELAVDTSQFGRTFQDRSHTFKITKRPADVPSTARIFNLNVRGKRGNIVQVYPAVEYDFVPQLLSVRASDYVHFQWTGCDTNPAGNAGEGRDGTDRSNIVQMISQANSAPITDAWIAANSGKLMLPTAQLRILFGELNQTNCKKTNDEQDQQNCAKLNAASRYFNGGVLKMSNTGSYYYMSTRNNNFSNRDQKGVIYVNALLPDWAVAVLASGGAVFLLSAVAGASMIYAKKNPQSKVAALLAKI